MMAVVVVRNGAMTSYCPLCPGSAAYGGKLKYVNDGYKKEASFCTRNEAERKKKMKKDRENNCLVTV